MAMNVPLNSLVRSEQPLSLITQVKHGEKQNYNPDFWHMKFRAFSPLKGSDPIQDLRRISELCYQWLRPDVHSKEEILDQLVLEQFLTCTSPELQALVKESRVRSCKDLEKMLRDRKVHKWSIIYSQGQAYLLQDPSAEMAEGPGDNRDPVDLSQGHLSNESKESLNRGQASPELQNLSETEEPSVRLEEDFLLGGIPERTRPDYLRPQQSLESDSVPDWEKAEVSAFIGQDPQLTQGPAGSLRVNGAVLPQEDTDVDVVPSFTHILERELALNRDPQSLRGFNLPASQGVASCMDNTEDGLEAANPQPANPQPVEKLDSLAGQARFQCTECKKSFLYKSHFDLHQRTHTGERPFKCNLCNKAFLQSSDLRVHQRVHTGEKPYTCAICRKGFAHGSTLQKHNRIHTKEKPYACEDCGKRFRHKANLTVHFRIHRDLRPYICKKCNMAFRQQGTWKRHMKTHLRTASV
ncbi:zinc finger and SCAN domain-containing protein 5B-like [Apodemus sylvaticus]|uniref:zinc finger and SCAN domain-containing protein 5B-like n=1 Tax=Apodemus sylvaticus TaxID=10129 RepID=UPI002244F48B|nr:zinc finger and SCAN domain-containing protein 5B-like [Apodemus sylvaticus]